ncbi:MAG: coenzyme A pyrophosphatase, partial [Bacteroidia bacterium]
PSEVQRGIPLSLSELLDDKLIKETHLELEKGLKIKTPYFDVRGKVLWGATAMILNELKHILKSNSSFSQSQ